MTFIVNWHLILVRILRKMQNFYFSSYSQKELIDLIGLLTVRNSKFCVTSRQKLLCYSQTDGMSSNSFSCCFVGKKVTDRQTNSNFINIDVSEVLLTDRISLVTHRQNILNYVSPCLSSVTHRQTN